MNLVESCIISLFEGLREKRFDNQFSLLPHIIQNQLKDFVDCLKKNNLIFACKKGCTSAVIYLVERGADIHYGTEWAIRMAAHYGHLDVVKYLVGVGADIRANDDEALQNAAQYGRLDVVKFLVEKGADIHAKNDLALRWAAENGYLDVVKYLVEKGANVHAGDDIALRRVAENGEKHVVNYLLQFYDKDTAIYSRTDLLSKTMQQLRTIILSIGFTCPNHGTGKRSNVLKKDLVGYILSNQEGKCSTNGDRRYTLSQLKRKTIRELKEILSQEGIPLPSSGSGRNGRVLKKDIIDAILNSV